METKNLESKIDALKASVEVLIMIEFCKRAVKRDEVRGILGSLDNNLFSKINKAINGKTQK